MSFLWFLEGIRTPAADKFMQFITYFGQELFIIVVICALYWCVDKRFAYVLGFTYFVSGLGVQALKITFRIPRPWVIDPSFRPVESAVEGASGFSFPSGHTQGAAALFFPLALKEKNRAARLCFISMFLLIGFSRMYLGCHTLKDVVVSMLLTILVSVVVWKFQGILLDNEQYTGRIACVLMVLSLAAATYALMLYHGGIIEKAYAVDCCKAAGAGLGFAVGFYIERKKICFDTHMESAAGQVKKLIAGLAAAVVLQELSGFILGSSVLAKMAEYFILVLWVLVIYPFIFQRICQKSQRRSS